MAITRYDPFRDLFKLQDQLFRTFGEAYAPREESGLTQTLACRVSASRTVAFQALSISMPGPTTSTGCLASFSLRARSSRGRRC